MGKYHAMERLKRNQAAAETLASQAFLRLRREIIEGLFVPGEKLRVRQLSERYAIGASPMREALNRLSRDGLVEQADLRGFSVSGLNEEDLAGLTRARIWMNDRALRESFARGDAKWEEGVILSYYRLSRIPFAPPSVEPAWETAHRAFHTSLIAACGSLWMIRACEQLFDAADRYRYLSREAGCVEGPRSDEHRPMMEAVVARDEERAAQLLEAHFRRTEERSREELRRRAAAAGSPARARGRRAAA